jgi:hypothetical protein
LITAGIQIANSDIRNAVATEKDQINHFASGILSKARIDQP